MTKANTTDNAPKPAAGDRRTADGPAKVIVVQYGARRQYDMAAMLHSAGMLEALYTDMCATVGLGRAVLALSRPLASIRAAPGRVVQARIAKLAERVPPAGVRARTKTFARWTLDMERALRVKSDTPATMEASVRALEAAHARAGEAMVRHGTGAATHVLSVFLEGRAFLTHAKRNGLAVLTDMVIAPSTEAIVRAERKRHPGWEADGFYWGSTIADPTFRPAAQSMEATDLFLCPSAFVRDDLVGAHGVAPERTMILPYTVNPLWFDVVPAPEPGRILFAGEAGLRKGIHVLAAAADLLRARGRTYDIRIAGHASPTVRARPEVAGLNFLGRLNFSAMGEEFRKADLFVLPSLAEGSAGVTYEALGSAVPVVTTPSAGSIVRDGVEGRVVEAGDADALANAMEAIVEDRALRAQMAERAREAARALAWDSFEHRLVEAVHRASTVSGARSAGVSGAQGARGAGVSGAGQSGVRAASPAAGRPARKAQP